MSASGIVVINKPEGLASRKVTSIVSRIFSEKTAGHIGTLDPLATGVLPVALGKATRIVRFLEGGDKVYRATIRLGIATDSHDRAGATLSEKDPSALDPAEITASVASFRGALAQVPPMHSALKQNGVPLYKLARAGVEVERSPRRVTVMSIIVESIEMPFLTIRVRCSPGTYLRSIAHELGQKLKCGAHLHALVRTHSGPFTLEQAVALEGLEPEKAALALVPLIDCLPDFPALELERAAAALVRDGVPLPAPEGVKFSSKYRLVYEGRLLAVAESVAVEGTAEGRLLLKALRVFL